MLPISIKVYIKDIRIVDIDWWYIPRAFFYSKKIIIIVNN